MTEVPLGVNDCVVLASVVLSVLVKEVDGTDVVTSVAVELPSVDVKVDVCDGWLVVPSVEETVVGVELNC